MIIWIFFFLIGLFYLFYPKFYRKTNTNIPQKETKEPHFAAVIPARNESKVIEGLLKSLQNQTFPFSMEDVYVIVESETDPTVMITKNYGSHIIVRKHLDKRRKGYALEEGFEFILKSKKNYDAYFIFDADNILSPTYLEEMKKTYLEGYDIGIGYRNSKNGNHNMISACSTLTFSMINTLGNEAKNKYHENVVVSGTGFYIKGKWIQKWQGYPFHSLTEDYELYLYSILHEMTSFYNTKAVFYDEQPISFQQSILQRTRWIKGFFTSRKEYIPKIKKSIHKDTKNKGSKILECVGIKPYLFFIIGILGLFMTYLISGIEKVITFKNICQFEFLISFGILLFAYMVLLCFTAFLIHREKDLNLNRKMKIQALFFNPLFLATYILCLFKSMKKVEWVQIEHTESKIK